MAEIVRELPDFEEAVLVKHGEEHFVVSSVTAFDTGRFETLAFPANAQGEVVDWMDKYGGVGETREQVMAAIEREGAK